MDGRVSHGCLGDQNSQLGRAVLRHIWEVGTLKLQKVFPVEQAGGTWSLEQGPQNTGMTCCSKPCLLCCCLLYAVSDLFVMDSGVS